MTPNKPHQNHLDGDNGNGLGKPDEYLQFVCQYSSTVNQTIEQYGEISLSEYLTKLTPNVESPYQPRDDLIHIVYRYTNGLLGDSTATQIAKALSESPIILTANHHGVDYFSHSFQGSILFSLSKRKPMNGSNAVPVFSCGNIPLDNATYPQGMLFYRVDPDQLWAMPKRLPVFPNRLRRQLVSGAPPFDKEMVERAEKRFVKMVKDKQISSILQNATDSILYKDYSNPAVVERSSYSEQSVLLNNLVWKRLFADNKFSTEIVYLELEKIAGELLKLDLKNETSLAWQIMFEPSLRKTLLEELDGASACWDLSQLKSRLQNNQSEEITKKNFNGSGTIFFWGLNESGRRTPLYLESNGMLRGIDDHNKLWEITFSPECISAALNKNHLLPSLFTCFLVLSFARGVKCIGSYFQGEYLPKMQQGLVHSLNRLTDFQDIAGKVEKIDPNFYLSGMLPVMTRAENDYLVPAGPLEIISGGGLNKEDFERMLSIKVRDAHLAALHETLPDFIPWILRNSGWKKRLAQDALRSLEGKVVVK